MDWDVVKPHWERHRDRDRAWRMTPLSSSGERQKPGDALQNALYNEFDECQSWTQLKDNREHKEQDETERILHQWYVLYLSRHILHLFISNLEVTSHAIRILISLEGSIISDTLVLGPKEIDGCFQMLVFMESSLECCFLLVLTLQIMLVHDRYIYTDRKPFESLPNDYSCPGQLVGLSPWILFSLSNLINCQDYAHKDHHTQNQ